MAGKRSNILTRSIFIIDKKFQIKYALLLAALGALLTLILSGHVFYFVHENFQIFIPNYSKNPDIMKLILSDQKKIALYLVALSFMLVSFLFFIGIIVTHRMAGPIMVMRRKIIDLRNGDFSARVHLRKGDEFKELADSFNEMAEHLGKRFEELEKKQGNSGLL
ncbi:MAG: HAMP domain-containing protein [Oligoflexia bacterium]|nr:HAMP domain-containing protein [Oligoflexia bacterium]